MEYYKNLWNMENIAKFKGICPLYCEYVVEGIDYKTVQVALRDHILDEYEGNIRKSYMKKAKGKKS
jgi:hypothetical protein